MASSSSILQLIAVSILLLSFTLALLLFHPLFPRRPPPLHLQFTPPISSSSSVTARILLQSPSPLNSSSCSSILDLPPDRRCAFARALCAGDSRGGLLNYAALHFCLLRGRPALSLPLLALLLLLHFRLLAAAASAHFSPIVARLAARLRLSPSMAAVTLLAFGNGAPDAFASVAALRGGHPRTGFAAILSAGAFVSAFVVGAVALRAAPFALDPGPFVRDVFFYLVSASALFYVYLSAEIFLWQAVGFVLFYLFFVGFVFWMDSLRVDVGRGKGGHLEMMAMNEEEKRSIDPVVIADCESGRTAPYVEYEEKDAESDSRLCNMLLRQVTQIWEVPISTVLKLTIPSPFKWSRFYISANIGLCPLILLYSFSSFISLDRKIVFLIPQYHFPLWSVVLFVSICLAVAHYLIEKEPPENEQIAATLIAFMMSVFWISTMAGELLNCLAAIGTIMELPPAILGLTVLAWGNSIGDLVADVALAKAGQPAMAMAGCFAGPMFNMLVGLGTAMVVETAGAYPAAYELRFNVSIVVAFVFLLVSLMGSLLVLTWYRFRVPRFWGYCLVGLYLLFTAVSLLISSFSDPGID